MNVCCGSKRGKKKKGKKGKKGRGHSRRGREAGRAAGAGRFRQSISELKADIEDDLEEGPS